MSPPIICPTLVGRADPLAALHLLIEQTKQGERQVVLISGEAGIGKSRLIVEAKTYAQTQGFLLLQGNCFPTDLTYPYAPLLDLLRSTLALNPTGSLASAIEALAYDIFPLLPELVPRETIPSSRLEPEQEKRRLFAVLTKFFLDLSTHSPILLIIEDIHWCDDTSLDLLHHLARHSAAHPLLLLVTYRHNEMQPELRGWLAQLERERLAQGIRLLPLARSEVDAMLSAIFEQQHTAFDMRRFLHGELLDTLYTLTEGNPFFVEETLGSLITEGDIFYVQGYWNHKPGSRSSIPQSIQDAVQRRTKQVSEEAKHVLTLAAVAGKHFDFALLQQLTHHDEHQLLALMKELVSAQLVIEESADRFAFRHALTRQAIYTQLLARERRMLHQTIAETMEQQSSATLDMYLEDLAYHFYQAKVWRKALDYARRAGEKSLQLYSHRAAIDYLTWALDAVDHLSLPPVSSFYRARGHAHEMLGEFEQAQRDYTQALNAAHTAKDRVAEWQGMTDLGFLWAARDYTQAEAWLRRALVLSQELNDPALHARSLNRIGNWHLNVEQPQEALRYHQEALTIFQQLHDTRGVAETLDLLGMTSYLGGDLIGGTAYYQQVIPLFSELGDRQGLTSCLATLTLRGPTFQTDTMISAGSLAEALQDAERALRIAREIGHRSGEAYALFQLGLCLGSQGEFGRALAMVQQCLTIAEEIEHNQWQTAAHTILGGVYSNLFAYTQASEHFEQALVLAREVGSLFWTRITGGYLASIAIMQHNLTHAEAILQTTLSHDMPAQTMAQRMAWCAAIELALAQHNPEKALTLVDQLDAASATVIEERRSLRMTALRGDALAALQRLTEAEATLKTAQQIATEQGARPMQWRLGVRLGNIYHVQRRAAEAEKAFSAARLLIDELAATISASSLQSDFLRRAAALLPQIHTPPDRGTKRTIAGLTEREREVVILVAQGKSNQAIADALVVTKRTVETHVGNIMFKLGFTSRTQIAVWAVEAGLVDKTE